MRAFSSLLATTIIMGFVIIIIVGISTLNLNNLKSSVSTVQFGTTQQYTESCIEEILRRLKDDISFPGGTIPISDNITCDSSVVGNGEQKVVSATVSRQNTYASISVEIEITTINESKNFTITSWQPINL